MRIVVVMAAVCALAACGGGTDTGNASGAANTSPAAPVKQQPGSWTNKIEITRLDVPGVDNDKMRQGLQTMFDAASGKSICVTQAMVDRNNVTKNIEQLAAQGKKCDFSRKVQDGEKLDFAGTCTDTNGTRVKLAITGNNGATAQDMRIVSEPMDASGKSQGAMELRMQLRRTGECKPGDMQVPVPA